MKNQNLQQSLIETNAKAKNITRTHLAKNRHMINGWVDVLKGMQNTVDHNNLASSRLNFTKLN